MYSPSGSVLADVVAVTMKALPLSELAASFLLHRESRFFGRRFGVVRYLRLTAVVQMGPDMNQAFDVPASKVLPHSFKRKLVSEAEDDVSKLHE